MPIELILPLVAPVDVSTVFGCGKMLLSGEESEGQLVFIAGLVVVSLLDILEKLLVLQLEPLLLPKQFSFSLLPLKLSLNNGVFLLFFIADATLVG